MTDVTQNRLYLYGPITGFTSYPLALQGFRRAFKTHGLDPIEIDLSSGAGGENSKRMNIGLPPVPREAELVFAMKPNAMLRHLVTKHGMKLVGKHAGDVDQVPEDWKKIIAHEELTVVPSDWMQTVLAKDGFDSYVSYPGITQDFLDAEDPPKRTENTLKLLHFCSSPVFPERKGTPQTLKAFEMLVLDGLDADLTLVIPENRRAIKRLLGGMAGGVRQRLNVMTWPIGMHGKQIVELYRKHDAVLVPSRAEGFSCCPIEARALGVPVVQTLCTGHQSHFKLDEIPAEQGVSVVSHGPFTDAWGDFGSAPEVTAEEVGLAILRLAAKYDDFRSAALAHRKHMAKWLWENTTRELVEKLKALV